MESLVGVVTAVTSDITGAVVSVVDELSVSVLPEVEVVLLSEDLAVSSSSSPHEIIMRQKRNAKIMCKALLFFPSIREEWNKDCRVKFPKYYN